jgi:hypothetical protein
MIKYLVFAALIAGMAWTSVQPLFAALHGV